ncbi:unnamed protein product [Boreogadus saida]
MAAAADRASAEVAGSPGAFVMAAAADRASAEPSEVVGRPSVKPQPKAGRHGAVIWARSSKTPVLQACVKWPNPPPPPPRSWPTGPRRRGPVSWTARPPQLPFSPGSGPLRPPAASEPPAGPTWTDPRSCQGQVGGGHSGSAPSPDDSFLFQSGGGGDRYLSQIYSIYLDS